MPRPSRSVEALEVLRTYYREHGILPTIEVLTELMGYRSPGSTYPVVKALVTAGYLQQEGKGGRLKPGPIFLEPTGCGPTFQIQPPKGCKTVLATVADCEHGILAGDVLIFDATSTGAPGVVVVIQEGLEISVATVTEELHPAGILGVLHLQYRNY